MENFKHQIPREYAYKLERFLGPPTIVGEGIIGWENVKEPYVRIEVRDEYVYHSFPAKHHDFVYSYAKIKLNPKQVCALANVTGSILPDTLTGVVGARCGGLTANDITLSFVEDVKSGKIKATKDNYAHRIRKKINTRKKYNMHILFQEHLNKEEDSCILL